MFVDVELNYVCLDRNATPYIPFPGFLIPCVEPPVRGSVSSPYANRKTRDEREVLQGFEKTTSLCKW